MNSFDEKSPRGNLKNFRAGSECNIEIRRVLSVYAFIGIDIGIEEYTDSTIFERGKKREF